MSFFVLGAEAGVAQLEAMRRLSAQHQQNAFDMQRRALGLGRIDVRDFGALPGEPCYIPEKINKSFIQELQSETDEWLKGVI